MEQFSYAYIRAVAATAGCDTGVLDMDYDSIDLMLRGRGYQGLIRNPTIDLQLKATHQDVVGEAEVSFRLSRKNYDDLRATNVSNPQLLVVVHVPENQTDWLSHTEDELALKRCAYWVSLRGQGVIEGETVTVKIPRQQQLTADTLSAIMTTVAAGGFP